MDGSRKVVISLHLPEGLHKLVKQEAEARTEDQGSFVSRTRVIEDALREHFGEDGRDARMRALDGMWPMLDDDAREFVMQAARYAKGAR